MRRAAYDRRAAVTQLHAGGAIAEELDLDDFACSVITDRLVTANVKCGSPLMLGLQAAECEPFRFASSLVMSSQQVLRSCGYSIMLLVVTAPATTI